MGLQRRYYRSTNWSAKVTFVVLIFWVVNAISHPPVSDDKDIVENEVDRYGFLAELWLGEQSYEEVLSLIKSASDKAIMKLCLALPLLLPYNPSNNALNHQAADPGSQLLTAHRIAVVIHLGNGLVATVQLLTDSSEAVACFSSAFIVLFVDSVYIALHPTGRFDSERLIYSESLSVISKSAVITGLFLKAQLAVIEEKIIKPYIPYIDEADSLWAQAITKGFLSGAVMLFITIETLGGIFNPDLIINRQLTDVPQWSLFDRFAVLFKKNLPEAASIAAAYMAYSGLKDVVHSAYNIAETFFEIQDPATQKVICSAVTTLILSSLSYRLMTHSPTSGFSVVFLETIAEASGFGASEFLADLSEKMNLGGPVFNDLLGLALQLELFIFIKTQASPDSKYHNIYAAGVLLPLMISGIQTGVMNTIATAAYTAMHAERVLRSIVFFL